MTQRIKDTARRYSVGAQTLSASLLLARTTALMAPPRLTVSDWARRYAYLSPETSAEPGKFKSFAYQDGILDAVSDPTVTKISVKKSARVGYTKCLDHIVGYFIHQDPAPILLVQPRVEDAEDYSRTEIAPMLRDTPVLAEIAGDLKAKDSNQRIAKRVFRNGSSLAFIGANSPGGFRRITARIALFDEVDGYPVGGAGDEGDQVALGIQRTVSFWNRKIVLGSTPTLKGQSRIDREFQASDQRLFFVPCPHCGHEQVLRWQNLRWDKDADGNHLPETAHFVCEESGCVIEEHHKPAMIAAGRWIAQEPFSGHAGFHIWAAYSLFPNAAWRHLVAEFLRVHKDPSLLQTFVNLVLGEVWEEQGETVDSTSLAGRAEAYDDESLPDEIIALTAGVDTQDDRLEVQVIAWGAREESWPCLYEVIHGDPAQPAVWADLDELLLQSFKTQDGRTLRLRATCMDSGGHHGAAVLSFARARRARRVFAIKGQSGTRPVWPKRATRGKTRAADVFMVGVDTAKDAIYGRLRIAAPGPGYVHFPKAEGFEADYFAQLTSETVVTRYREGRPYRVWVLPKGKRNEALDTFVYAFAALRSTSLRLDRPGAAPPRRDANETPDAPAADEMPPAAAVSASRPSGPPKKRKSSWWGPRRRLL